MLKRILYPKHRIGLETLKKNFEGKMVVITGASRGIGYELAKTLIAAKANLFLIARSENELISLCEKAHESGCLATYKAIDLRDRDA